MKLELEPIVYRMLPVHLIERRDGAMVKRGALEVKVKGGRAAEVLGRIIEAGRTGATRDQLRERFTEAERPAVDYLLDQFIERRLLVPVDEAAPPAEDTPEGIFYWELGEDREGVRARLREVRLVVVGVNEIARELSRGLRRGGFEHVEVVDYPLFRNMRLFGPDGALDAREWTEPATTGFEEWDANATTDSVDCLVATSDLGGSHWMRKWNELCVTHGIQFFPVILQDSIGYVGPYVVPGETACFECLRARQNSHLDDPEDERAFEMQAHESRRVVGAHPAMAGAIAHIAVMELVKFFSRTLPFRQVATLVELNLLAPWLVTRKVLRIPNCAVCRMVQKHAAVSPDATETMPGNWGRT